MARNAERRFRFRNVATAALMLCSGPVLASGDYLIQNHGVVDDLDVTEARAKGSGTGALTLSTNVLGRDLVMELQSNEGLTTSMAADEGKAKASASGFELLRGTLQGIDGSWVRLTRSEGKFTGVIYDGERLLAMEPFEEVQDMLPNAAAGAGDHVVYDTGDVIAMNGQSCGIEGHDIGGDTLVDELQQLRAKAVSGQLNVAFLVDEPFARVNDNVDEAVLTRLNIVDGIFSEQVGIRLNPSEIRQVGNNEGLNSSDAGRLLDQLSSSYRNSGRSNPGLVHLFTGRELDGAVVGVAVLSAICNERSGFALTQSTSSSSPVTASLIAAHEFGHNFGAPHDNQRGSSCASTPGTFLMNPGLNGSDTFSQCSLSRIEPVVERASCIVPVSDPQPPAPTPEPEPDPTPEPDPSPEPDPLVLAFDFDDRTTQGFTFRADPWGLGNAPGYQNAFIVTSENLGGSALLIELGNRDDRDVTNMSAGFNRTFELEAASDLQISFRVDLRQSSRYERDEFSEIRASFDGEFLEDGGDPRLAVIRGDGNGGGVRATGFRTYRFDLESVPAGQHELTIGGFNNKKTEFPEKTEILVDDVRIESRASAQAAVKDSGFGGDLRETLGSRLVGLR